MITCVAPACLAKASLFSSLSRRKFGVRPASFSPSTTLSPTPHAEDGGRGAGLDLGGVHHRADAGHIAQPNSVAISIGCDLSIFISDSGAATVYSE
ncbi:MAG: hypothetical protein CM1200mP29_16730 [Verrucomicrobiota bacterium]|nr:MAG: hypothetical protein CM1200mP29_16730 [Verrucomicrobiota bacterium]